MNTRLTRNLSAVAQALSVIFGLAFLGKAGVRLSDDGAICVETGFWANARLADPLSVAPGVEASSSAARLCQESPSVAQRLADLGSELPWLLFGALALVLFARMLKAVMEQGPFTEMVARRLTVLGWFVAVGTPVTGLVAGWSQGWLVASMAPMVGVEQVVSGPTALTLAGLAAVVMGKIMREGVRMREDLEGTI
ncbi:DUF2975 domain-containing protein [Streptomyces sp. SID8014]|uniref:DUF2975 domain-containing protein n=1 Tax=Streptomyces sp. SID8014 TaxID=2706097 RepID=UPI0013BA64D9|nr:DUF2975 domain-containing protein [Streptomyces sp. SID8014]NEC13225.1 DUF2975 domain-containing protein [Streptomyces sp. SID8014]